MTPQEYWEHLHAPDKWQLANPQAQSDWLESHSHGYAQGAALSQTLYERTTRLQNENLALLRENIAQRKKIAELEGHNNNLRAQIARLHDRIGELGGDDE